MYTLAGRIERVLNNSHIFYAALIIACLVFIGVPLLYQPGDEINPDPYQHLSIANYYLLDSSPVLRDALTVGPVIPALIAIPKYILAGLFQWNRHLDVFLLKGLALLCYLVIVINAGVYLKKTVPSIMVFVFLLLFMGLPEWRTDSLSLNGELVSVAWLTLLLAYLNKSNRSPNAFIVSVLALLVIYTKIQSGVLLLLLLASFYYDKKEKWKTLFAFIALLFFTELALYVNGTGLAHGANDLLSYVKHPGAEKSIQEVSHGNRYMVNLPWAVEWVQRFVPLFGFVVGYLLLSNQKRTGGFLTDWRIWLLALFITILTPGRQFGHYVLYAMLFVIIFSEPVLRGFAEKSREHGKVSVLSLSVIVVFLFINTAKYVTSIAEAKLWLGPDVEAVAALTKKDGGRVHIHGWDYKLYTYFNGWNDGTDLFYVTMGRATPSWYLDRILDKKYKYIIDVVGYSGYINDPSYKITGSTVYGRSLAKYYELVSNGNGLRVYRLMNDIK